MSRRGLAVFVLSCLAASPLQAWEPAALGIKPLNMGDVKGIKIGLYGFMENDFIFDTTQPSFFEEEDNTLVPKPNTYAGSHGRNLMSIRNSRLGIDVQLPETPSGIKTDAVFEVDFLGNQGVNTLPGQSGTGVQSENNYFNNPALRVRHAYVDVGYKRFQALVGQTWSLLGFQPDYFPGEVVVQPTPGQLYRRFPQIRATQDWDFSSDWDLEGAADAARPAAMNSGAPMAQGGLRLLSTKYYGASVNNTQTAPVALSAALSGDLIPTTAYANGAAGTTNGYAAAFDFLVPLVASKDPRDLGNTLSWVGEGTYGAGLGGLELVNLTFGLPQVGNGSAVCPGAPTLDPGIAGCTGSNSIDLIRAESLRTDLEYVFPDKEWTTSAGYAQVDGLNLGEFTAALSSADQLGIAPKIQFGYADLFYEPLKWLRFAFEWNQTRDTYNDASARFAVNNRYQFTTFFVF